MLSLVYWLEDTYLVQSDTEPNNGRSRRRVTNLTTTVTDNDNTLDAASHAIHLPNIRVEYMLGDTMSGQMTS